MIITERNAKGHLLYRNDSDRRGRPLCLPCPGCGLSGFGEHVIARAGQPRGDCPYDLSPVIFSAAWYYKDSQ